MILHLLQWYLLIGCVVMGISILTILIFGSGARTFCEENDESRADIFIGIVILYFIWPYYVIMCVKATKKITK